MTTAVKTHDLGPLQFELLKLMWQKGVGTVQEMVDAWPVKNHRQPAYVTILTVLRRLEHRGFLTHTLRGKAFVYTPIVSEQTVKESIIRDMAYRLFDGPRQLVEMANRLPN